MSSGTTACHVGTEYDAGLTSPYKSVWDVPAKEMAEELTFMDWHLFQSVPLSEFLANGWDRPRCSTPSPR